MRLAAGASGYSYKEWRGTFYPENLKPDAMLARYGQRPPTVEINNTFYPMPKATELENWAGSTPDDFRFAIKAPKRTTHVARLKGETAAEPVGFLYKNLAVLGAKRGPVLFHLPPKMKKNLPPLRVSVPERHGAAFEFRNDSWFADDVYDAQGCQCGAGPFRTKTTRPAAGGNGSLGLRPVRLETYSDNDLRQWADRLAATAWREIYAYFMHEPTAPAYAQTLMRFGTG